MKKYMSVLMMCARQSIYKLLGVLLLMVVSEGIWSFAELQGGGYGSGELDVGYGLSRIYQSLILYGILFVVWWIFTVILGIYGCRFKEGSASVLRRLQISRGKVFWIQVLYNCIAYIMLLSVQMIILFVIGSIYSNQFPQESGPQTIFLALVEYTYAFESTVVDMASPFVGTFGWFLRFCSIAVFSVSTACITTGLLNTEGN